MRTRHTPIVAGLLVVVGLVGHGHAQQASAVKAAASPGSGTVSVFAAASLAAAFKAIAGAVQKAHPDTKVQLNFAGSSTLVQQIQEGGPADVFASADEATMQRLANAVGAPRLFARNRLQIVVPAGNPRHIAGLADLTRAGLTIALCGPTVPCGRYATEAFRKAGVAVPAASQELDVKAVLSKVMLGEADAGVVYVTDVRAAGGKVEGVEIPDSANVVARYPIAVLKNAPNAAAGAMFVDYVLSSEGQQLLAGFGFLPP